MTKAAIAIGSNSTRLLALKPSGEALRARAETRLMMGLNAEGMLTREAIAFTAEAVKGLKAQAIAFGAEKIALYATSATRDAKNAEEFANALRGAAGLELQVLSGQTEAQMAFLAASGGEHCAVLDIGGGSSEMTFGQNERVESAVSAQEGASRLLKREGEITTLSKAQALLTGVKGRLLKVYQPLLQKTRPPKLVGIGGTATTAAAIFRSTDSHGEDLEGTKLTLTEARRQLSLLAPLSLEERALVRGLYPSRVHMMPHGLCILIAAMELFGYDELTVSVRNNLDALVRRLS